MTRERLAIETDTGDAYPEGRCIFGLCDLSVCGPMLLDAAERDLLLELIPETGEYLEVGCWTASTLSWIADRRPGVHCVGVDCYEGPTQRRMFAALANWDLRPNVDLFFGRADRFHWEPGRCDVVFVDGHHGAEAVYDDLVMGSKILKPGGKLLAHDYNKPDHPGVAAGVFKFCTDHGWQIDRQVCTVVVLTRLTVGPTGRVDVAKE